MNKRIRINTSVVVLEGNEITVFRKGEEHKCISIKDENALDIFERECAVEVLYHIHK